MSATIIGGVIGLFVVLFVYIYTFYGFRLLTKGIFDIPLSYDGDLLAIEFDAKRILEYGNYFYSVRSGYPFGSVLLDYALPDFGNFYLLASLTKLTGSVSSAADAFYALGYILSFLSGFLVLRGFELTPKFAMVGAILYAFSVFHILRIQHLFLCMYWVAPVFIFLGYKIATGRIESLINTPIKTASILFVLLMLPPFSGIYYTAFGLIVLFIAALINLFDMRNWRVAVIALGFMAVLLVSQLVLLSPFIWYRLHFGPNLVTGIRPPSHSEIYGLKIVQMLLPSPTHRFEGLRQLTARYDTTFPLVNENMSSSLGIIGSVGLICSVFNGIFRSKFGVRDSRIRFASSLVLSLVLIATIGGVSALFSLLVFPEIRAWNRISVFIHFLCLLLVLLLIEGGLSRLSSRKRLASWAIGIALLIFGILDQVPTACDGAGCRAKIGVLQASDASFISAVEGALPTGSAVFELPYTQFPEMPPVHTLSNSRPAIGYLYSANLKWSWGGIKGRPGDAFYLGLAKLPIAEQIDAMQKLGFSGVVIDRRGYADNGKQLELQLNSILGRNGTLTSQDGTMLFYPLPHPAPQMPDWSSVADAEQRLAAP